VTTRKKSEPTALVVTYMSVDELVFDPDNAREHIAGIPELAESLKQFGQRKPVVVWGGNIIIAGNGLVEAARTLEWNDIAVVHVPSDWDINKARAFALTDNRTAELSRWKLPEVTRQLFELSQLSWDMPKLGFERFNQSKRVEFDVTPQLGQTGYAIIVECDDERQQSELLEKFAKQKLRVRPLMT
jgi:ParB-like chromosome segregation protein Spo0J